MKSKYILPALIISIVISAVIISISLASQSSNIPEEIHSPVDFNQNGVDDYGDFVIGARKDAENHPTYNGAYWEDGYPPDNVGVCTDVVWRAFREAGYCLRLMVDKDIELHPEQYPAVENRDNNIDFRRVKNLYVFFKKYAISLTVNINDVNQWQPGDIVIFKDNQHIGIISDKRNSKGQPYVIHNGGQPEREEDFLSKSVVTAHFRFDASTVPQDFLIPWGADGKPEAGILPNTLSALDCNPLPSKINT